MSTRNRIRVDIAIVGGGIAGLWLMNVLQGRGYGTVLIERSAFGDGQTICSQGMIHGGLKYALGGMLTSASEAMAAMPQRWRNALLGHGELDLRGVRVLSDRYYMWTANDSTLGRLGGLLASTMLHGRARRLERPEHPPPFDDPAFRGRVYELDEMVLDTSSLLQHLADAQREHTLRADVSRNELIPRTDGGLHAIRLPDCEIEASHYLLTAGAGNESLLEALTKRAATEPPRMQRRPLHQMIVRAPQLPPLYGHCVDPFAGAEPRLTVTSHIDRVGGRVWYLGGALATRGVDRSTADQIRFAHTELRACLPWIDLSNAALEPLRMDRAEPRQSDGRRPDEAYVAAIANVLVCWPTKLSLVPDLGDKVLNALTEAPRIASDALPLGGSSLCVADAPWDS